MDGVADADLHVLVLPGHTHIGLAELAEQIERRLRLLSKGEPQRVLAAALTHRLLLVFRYTVEAVSRTGAGDPLMRTLMIVIVNPMFKTLARISEGRKDRLLQEFRPEGLPEALDLAQGHRVMRRAPDVADALPLQDLLEAALAPPRDKLAAVVGQDLPRRTPLSDGALDHLQDRIGLLLAEETVAHDVAGVVVDDPDQVHTVHPLQLEGEDVDLPERIGDRALEAARSLGLALSAGLGVALTGVVDNATDGLCADRQAFLASEVVADSADAAFRVLRPALQDPLLDCLTATAYTQVGGALSKALDATRLVLPAPVMDRMITDADQLSDLGPAEPL